MALPLALGIVEEALRKEWDAYDLLLEDGTKIEVKSAAYVRAWKQGRDSIIQFGVPKRRAVGCRSRHPERGRTRTPRTCTLALLSPVRRLVSVRLAGQASS